MTKHIWKINLQAQHQYLLPIEEFFNEYSENISSYEIASTTVETKPDDLWAIDIFFDQKPDLKTIGSKFSSFAETNNIKTTSNLELGIIEDIDWVTKLQEEFKPIEIGSFLITNELPPGTKSDNVIVLNASRAFGTGEHETSQGCILALERVASKRKVKNALDVGTGTGILAIASSKLWPAADIYASDIDESATEIAQQHFELNDLQIDLRQADGIANYQQKFDLIIANILANPLMQLAADFKTNLQPSGQLILSGFLDYQLADLLKCYNDNGFSPIDLINYNSWITLTMKLK